VIILENIKDSRKFQPGIWGAVDSREFPEDLVTGQQCYESGKNYFVTYLTFGAISDMISYSLPVAVW